MLARARPIAARFAVPGDILAVEPFGPGHINDSFVVTAVCAGVRRRYLLQRINTAVFARPAQLMENIRRVTDHIARRLRARGEVELERRALALVPPREGGVYLCDESGGTWRMYRFIEGTRAVDAAATTAEARSAARAFGEFQSLLADYSGPRLHETIAEFHNTPLRYAALDEAVRADVGGRVAAVRAELALAERYRPRASVLLDLRRAGEIPERIVHNDAKVSNVLFDATTGVALCVVDLDTVMPGLSLYDFGDLVRSMATTAAEDEVELRNVDVRPERFEALARGYLEAAGGFLTPAERAHLVDAGQLITLEQAVRFLTDFLRGDRYYKTQRPGHNLDRCRAQLALVESIERQAAALRRIVERI